MNDQQLLRYSRQLMLPYVDYAGQQKLLQSRVLLIGLGGLGSPIAIYLAAAGIGHLVLNDFDEVDISNLQRQILHFEDDIGKKKGYSAKNTLQQLNAATNITVLDTELNKEQLSNEIKAADIVVDATDNFPIRFLINHYCVKHTTPLVSGAAIRMEGQITSYQNNKGSPCYACLYPEQLANEENNNCSEQGVLSPLVGIIGSMQATETLKILLDIGKPLYGRLLIFDALNMEWQSISYHQDPDCSHCKPRK
jgi:adenylyltransferase/sulfurtransferase